MNDVIRPRRLGSTGIELTAIGLGCMQFAGRGPGGMVFAPMPQERVDAVVEAAVRAGIGWFDTAEGYGHSERALATALARAGVPPGGVRIATKWNPTGRTARSIPRTFPAREAALHGRRVDLFQIHEPYTSIGRVGPQLTAMARLLEEGRIGGVGVSNFGARRMERAAALLNGRLATNQVRISLLHRDIERNGVLAAARRLGITLIAWQPLAGGLLTGRFHDDPEALRRIRPLRRLALVTRRSVERTTPLVNELRKIGHAHGVSVAQTALNWLITAYGETVVAIPGATRPEQAAESAAAMSFRLTDRERAAIDDQCRGLT
ncbi:aryl-alcohol dehydrogenase-like predicted oxidoreductase [Catenuloplanes nepalensis]|uniref:Aryl-alcohol dehydrogenase-like predicted oxidoreductase n=1 Tax=Catenuloplanes nepalensis TaxID=587533 RepID=A0ABT9MWW6_9ACTN|nr:aldo/keto reductase [Catenuloplanes nepalensis]MDP9795516.1 aryl-alcohol dehydrogenase-like predicted oxidoreductase [Catenuloplanes nepalensis]